MKTNTKIVREQVRQHILEFVNGDIDLLIGNLNAVKYNNMNDYQAGVENVNGGNFLIYHDDVAEFLNGLGINPEGKEYSVDKSWDLYKHLVASELEKIAKELK